jgi:hypothetical protein
LCCGSLVIEFGLDALVVRKNIEIQKTVRHGAKVGALQRTAASRAVVARRAGVALAGNGQPLSTFPPAPPKAVIVACDAADRSHRPLA